MGFYVAGKEKLNPRPLLYESTALPLSYTGDWGVWERWEGWLALGSTGLPARGVIIVCLRWSFGLGCVLGAIGVNSCQAEA